ncbi:hypothetical protein ACFXA3_19530 [Streptomyces sp. NPDC059456]|uniref:hypothetical protein n=1 Tax=Streptomyces sp. NPDC059456 TaxID=3346838 RepID=UPI0036B6F546
MASNRSIRALAAVAALPFAVALFAGTARADNGAGAGISSDAAVAEILGSGVAGGNLGTSSTAQQVATGSGASDQSNGAQSNGAVSTALGQSNGSLLFHPAP